MIYTFYSYKGGVGRSMAMANVGELFYQAGLNVLLVDWDLEAPGLERFFARGDEKTAAQPGVIDLLLDYKHQVTQEWTTEDGQYPFTKPADLTIDLHRDSPKGQLKLLTAGRRDKANFARYANAVLSFDWKDFYDNWEGEAYFEWLREQFLAMADVVLIDSRTGITEMGGVCTYQLGDVVIMFCGTSQQSLDGTERMVTELKSSAVEEARGRSLEVIVIPAKVDKESGVGDEFRNEFLQRFAKYTPEIFKRGSDYFWQLTIPYATVCAYKEMIVMPQSSVGSEDVYSAFARLTLSLSRLAPIESAIRRALPEREFHIDNETQIVGARIGGQVVITGDGNVVTMNLPYETRSLDDDKAKSLYLHHVIESNRYLQLQGIRSPTGLVSVELDSVYIPCSVARSQDMTTQPERLQIQEALSRWTRLVVLDEPGSGKTTLLRYIALVYARDLIEEGEFVLQRLQLDKQLLPILLPLRDFARYLERVFPDADADGPKMLLSYLHEYFRNQQLELPQEFFVKYLEEGESILLLDGLDEVRSMATRQRIARIIEKFTITYPQCRYIVTSRVGGYSGGARLTADYLPITLFGFSEANMEQFVLNWSRTVEVTLFGETPEVLQRADRQGRIFWEAMIRSDRLRELAANPLFLTVLLVVHRYRAALPERRVDVYEAILDILLGTWDAAKGVLDATMLDLLDIAERRALLEPIAKWMMEQEIYELELYDLRSILQTQLVDMVDNRHQIRKIMDGFIHFATERSGIMTETQVGMFSFAHRTFQEYLAARDIANSEDFILYTLARSSNPWWREVILLESGYLSTQSQRRTTQLIRAIMEHYEEPELYHNLVLAAEALQEAGTSRIESAIWEDICTRLRQAFETPLQGTDKEEKLLGIQRRAAAAEALARLESGTSSTQPAFWNLPYGEPKWVEVPDGNFSMGDRNGADNEKPVHEVYQERFWISRVPVTNAQYQIFVEITEHHPPTHWNLGKSPKGRESHPVVNVSWRDAVAYCDWLSTVTGQTVALPTEAQWEKAAKGNNPRKYPWGDEADDTQSNNSTLGLNDTTPVGIFPEGASPYGCLDMSGNVREWVNSIYKEYPYNIFDGRENRENRENHQESSRVVRGGGFQSGQDALRCAKRAGQSMDSHAPDLGFRVVISRQLLPELSRDLTALRQYLIQNFEDFKLDLVLRDIFPDVYNTVSKDATPADKVGALLTYCRLEPESGELLLRLVREPEKIHSIDTPVKPSMRVQLDEPAALRMARRALAILEEQAAGYTSLTVPVHLKLALEEKRYEVAQLESRSGRASITIAGRDIVGDSNTIVDQRGQSITSQVNIEANDYISLSVLRRQLARLDDVEMDALCLDHFPEVYGRFARGLRRDEKINLLLDHCRRRPADAAKLSKILDW